jgi:hypothetical protein
MSKAEKLAAKILSGKSDKNFAFNDLCYVLEHAGFQSRSGRGSHRIYYKEGVVDCQRAAAQRKSEAVSSKTGA